MAVIQIDPAIKEEIALCLVHEQSAGYDRQYMGEWYVVDGKRVAHAELNRQFDPWHDEAKVISVDELIFEVGGAEEDGATFDTPSPCSDEEFEAVVSFAYFYVPDSYEVDDA